MLKAKLPKAPGTTCKPALTTNGVCFLRGRAPTITSTSGAGGDSPPPMQAFNSTTLMAAPKDGSGEAVPFEIYPPGLDTNSLVIFETKTTVWVPQAAAPRVAMTDGPQPLSGGGGAP